MNVSKFHNRAVGRLLGRLASHPGARLIERRVIGVEDVADWRRPYPMHNGVARPRVNSYSWQMDTAQADHTPPQSWIGDLAEGRADMATGRVMAIDVEALCREIEADADALERRQRTRPASAA